MRPRITATIAAAAALWLNAVKSAGVRSAAAAADGAAWGADFFPNVSFTTHQGKTVRFYDDLIKGKTVAIDLIYTTCKYACPLETARLAQVQRLLGDRVGREIFMYSITVDPQRDTPAVLRAYARMAHARAGWLFLTGETSDIHRLRASFGDDPALTFDRSDHLNLIAYGVEPLERWGGFPAWTEPATMVRLLSSIEPAGQHRW
jgi:protein SCO1/2